MSEEEGNLPSGWTGAPLADLAESCLGKMLDKSKNSGRPHPYLRNQNVRWQAVDLSDVQEMLFEESEAERFGLRVGDVLVCEGGEPGRAAMWQYEIPAMRFQKAIHRVRCGPSLLPEWLVFSFLRDASFGRLKALFTGTGIAHLTGQSLAKLLITLPPLAEQRRIVAKLDDLRARSRRAREALDEVPALLDQLKQSVLAAAFRGDLTAEWRARNPDVEPASVLLDRLERPPRPNRWESRSINVIPGHHGLSVGDPGTPLPQGWTWTPLANVARLESGHTPSREHPEWWGGDVPWLSIPDARDHHAATIHRTVDTTNELGLANSAARLLAAGTVCLCRTAASKGYVTVLGVPMATSQDFVNWTCTEAVDPHWLKHLFVAEKEALITRFSKGSTHTTIYFPEVLAFHVALPPIREQREVVTILDERLRALRSISTALGSAGDDIDSLDQAILAKAFRGELVPQDPNDEPADVLLTRIKAEADPTKPSRRRRGRQPREAGP